MMLRNPRCPLSKLPATWYRDIWTLYTLFWYEWIDHGLPVVPRDDFI